MTIIEDAQQAWSELPEDYKGIIEKFIKVGKGINALHAENLKLNRLQVSKLVSETFKGISKSEKTKLRYLADNEVEILKFVEAKGIRSMSAVYLADTYKKSLVVTGDIKGDDDEIKGDDDLLDDDLLDDEIKGDDDLLDRLPAPEKLKTGFGLQVRSTPRTVAEEIETLALSANRLIESFNCDELDDDDLDSIDHIGRNLLRHINAIEEMDKLAVG